MKHLFQALVAKVNTTKFGIGVLAALSGGTALALLPHERIFGRDPLFPTTGQHTPPPAVVETDALGVKIKVTPSQAKVVQGYGDEVYLDIDIDVPTLTTTSVERRPTDMVLVLDRSGSMGDGDKLGFAKAAMRAFVERLGDQDRIALVTFDDQATTEFPLTAITPESRGRLARFIDGIGLGGSTNIGDGLEHGRAALSANESGRTARVVLLSDGMANVGVADHEGLTAIVKKFGAAKAVVSTIGMGVDFNEVLLARLADHGMGNYSYLATLNNLGQVLEKDLGDARAQFAGVSHLLLDLGPGAVIADAAGYPIERAPDGRAMIPLGQLLEGTTRNLTLSVRVPTSSVGDQRVAAIDLTYEREGKSYTLKAGDGPFSIAVVAPERAAEALASIDGAVLKKSWVANNAGRMKKEFSDHIRNGRKEEATKVLGEYKAKLGQVKASTGVDTKDAALEAEISQLEHMADDAFAGAPAEQQAKQKSYSKEAWSSAIKSQRSVGKKP